MSGKITEFNTFLKIDLKPLKHHNQNITSKMNKSVHFFILFLINFIYICPLKAGNTVFQFRRKFKHNFNVEIILWQITTVLITSFDLYKGLFQYLPSH